MTTAAAGGQTDTDAAAAAAAAAAGGKPAGGDDAATAAAAAAAAAAGKPAGDAGGKPAGTDDAAAAAAAAAKKAPDAYTLTQPEGGYLEANDLKQFESLARAQNWTNAEAQAQLTAHVEGLKAQSARFLEETTADATYGGEKLEQTQTLAKMALEKLEPANTPEGKQIRDLLNKTGYGNHIAVVRLLAKIGALMSEDGPGLRGPASGELSLEDRLYPTMKS